MPSAPVCRRTSPQRSSATSTSGRRWGMPRSTRRTSSPTIGPSSRADAGCDRQRNTATSRRRNGTSSSATSSCARSPWAPAPATSERRACMSTVASDVRCFDPTLLRHSAWSRSATTSTTASPKPAAKAGSAKSPDSRPASLPPSRSFRPHANSAPARRRSPTSACPVQRPGRNDNPPVTRDTPDSDTFPRSSTESSEKIAFQPRLEADVPAGRGRPPQPAQMPLPLV